MPRAHDVAWPRVALVEAGGADSRLNALQFGEEEPKRTSVGSLLRLADVPRGPRARDPERIALGREFDSILFARQLLHSADDLQPPLEGRGAGNRAECSQEPGERVSHDLAEVG
jgi:hypothetical protein